MRRSDEPIYWGLFGAGGMVVAMLLPVIVLITGLLVPMGIMDVETMSYERALEFASSWWGACILLVIIALPIWHGMHRIYHGLHDPGSTPPSCTTMCSMASPSWCPPSLWVC